MSTRPRRAAIRPEAAEVLFEEVGFHDRAVESEQGRQPGPLVSGEVLRILEPEESGLLERRLLDSPQLPRRFAAHFIDGPAKMLRSSPESVSSPVLTRVAGKA